MKKILALILFSWAVFGQGLFYIRGEEGNERFEILIPESILLKGVKADFRNRKIDLGVLKEKGKIIIEENGEKTVITLKPFKPSSSPVSEKKYTHFRLRVTGEDEISINLPLWLLRVLFWFVPHIDVEGVTPEEEEAGKEMLYFMMHPGKYTGGYVGPLRFLYVHDEKETVEIVLD